MAQQPHDTCLLNMQLEEGHQWDYGAELNFVKELVDYWKEEYDWMKHQQYINQFPQYTMEIDGLQIHYIHFRSTREDAVPLVLLHG